MKQLEQKTAFITGGASGIGFAMAQAFGAAGMKIVIADANEERRKEAAEALTSRSISCISVALDVKSAEMWAEALDIAEREMGPVDLLCNNAGVGQGNRTDGSPLNLADIPEALFRMVFDINVTGVFLGVQAIVPRMIARGQGGHILNTGSMASMLAPAGLSAYAASKFAVAGLSESLRAELAPHNIGVSMLCPGGVQSNLVNSSAEQRQQAISKDIDDEQKLISSRPINQQVMLAENVGRRVLEAVQANQFYIFTHPEYQPLVEERFDAIRAAWAPSAQADYVDPKWLLDVSRNPVYAKLATSDFE